MDESKLPEIKNVSIGHFLIRTVLYLIPAFFFWYLAANIFCWPAIALTDLLMPLIMPNIVTGIEQQGYFINVVTELDMTNSQNQVGQLLFSLNALKYAYGFPLLYAMTLASPQSFYQKMDTLTYGSLLIILAQTWSICFEIASTLLLKLGVVNFKIITEALPFYADPIVLKGIALGYQLGFLILPAVVPIAYWVLRHQLFLKQIAVKKTS